MNTELMNKEEIPVLMTAKEASEVLGCCVRTVTRMCEKGILKGCRAGNRWRVNRDSLRAYAGCAEGA